MKDIRFKEKFQESEEEVNLLEMMHELSKHWLMIVFVSVLSAGIALAISMFLITPQYQSTAKLYLLGMGNDNTSMSEIQIGDNLSADYIEITKSRPILDSVSSKLGLSITYKELSSKVNVSINDDTHILAITVKDPDPTIAKKIADEIANVSKTYIAEKMGQSEPSILQYGYADENKVSPNKTKNTIIGGLGGFTITVAIIVLYWLVNDKIKDEEDCERKLGLVVLGTVPIDENLKKNGKREK